MAFEIRHIDPVTFRALYTSSVARQLDPFIEGARNWMRNLDDRRWALDQPRSACLLRTPMADPCDTRLTFSFVWEGQVVLTQQLGVSRYRIVHASSMTRERLADMKVLMKEALPLGYGLLNGVILGSNTRDFPEPEFVVG